MNKLNDIGFGTLELLLMPVYLGIFYLIIQRIRTAHADDPIYQKYFARGAWYKILGSIVFAFIYLYYYKGGDTINYFLTSSPLFKLAYSNPPRFIQFILFDDTYPYEVVWDVYRAGTGFLLQGASSISVIKVTSLINILGLNSFLLTSIVFALFSFFAHWRIYRVFIRMYPTLTDELAFAFLFIPSVLFWGSAISKDCIVLSGLFWGTASFYEILVYREKVFKNLLVIGLSFYIISLIRGYVIFALAPALIVMLALYSRTVFRAAILRYVLGPFLLVAAVLAIVFVVPRIGQSLQSYKLDSLVTKAEGFKSWHTHLAETSGNSGYSLGDFEYTPTGILSALPKALLFTMYGPFIWQVRNLVMLLSCLESMFIIYFTLRLLFRNSLGNTIRVLTNDPNIMFCLIFILIYGAACGLTSFNYGALVRYRIPILPLYLVALNLFNQKTQRSI